MDYSRADRVERLAAEYVAGTLRGAARSRFETLLPAHPALRRAVAEWQERLMPLSASIVPVEPPASLWKRIEARISGTAATAGAVEASSLGKAVRGLQSLFIWRGIAAFATLAALVLGLLLASPQPSEPPMVIVLSPPTTGTSTSPDAAPAVPQLIASVSGDGLSLVTRPMAPVSLAAPDRVLELWALPQQGPPRPLGLISPDGTTALRRSRIHGDTKALAVSVEPPGGSPTGAPTGPVILTGALTS